VLLFLPFTAFIQQAAEISHSQEHLANMYICFAPNVSALFILSTPMIDETVDR
jgi:hypothetical protein